MSILPLGKLPPDLLARMLETAPMDDPRLLVGPGVGLDCAVLALDDRCLVFKSDPITFATEDIGWYAVQVNANDIATTGAAPRWFLVTLLLPDGMATNNMIQQINKQLYDACRSLEISVIGGHTEITHGLTRPIIVGTMIGEVSKEALVTPKEASPGDRILLTKGVPIEGTAILAREFSSQLGDLLSDEEIQTARDYLFDPGISVVQDAGLAIQAGGVTAMHDPTEGGLAGALWELALACSHTLVIDTQAVFIPEIARKICEYFKINPLETIASGALLLTAPPVDAAAISTQLQAEGVDCYEIGFVEKGTPQVFQKTGNRRILLPRPDRDEIAKIFER